MLDTNLAAKPASLTVAVDFFNAGAALVSTWEAQSRTSAGESVDAWSGVAGSSFEQAILEGASVANEVAEELTHAAEHLATLLASLNECVEAMSEARNNARNSGLYVSTYKIYPPSQLVWASMYDPDSSEADRERAYSQAKAWQDASNLVYRANRTWLNAVDKYRGEAVTDGVSRLLDTSGVASDTALAIVVARVGFFSESVDSADDMISSIGRNIDALKVDGRVVGGGKFFYELVDERDLLNLRRADLTDALDASKRLGSSLSKASTALGIIGFGYGTFMDYQDGESVEQALVSNGVDWGVAAGFTVGGAAIGSFFAPPIGTVVGGLIGGAIGIFAGGFGNGVTDYLFEDLSPDLGGAISAGWDEVKATGESFGDAVSGAWNAIF